MLYKKIQSLFNPERYHGWGKEKKYFEGWYYKIVSADEQHAIAIIPGIAMDEEGNKHSFIQYLDGVNLESEYYKFPTQDFSSNADEFLTKINNNDFSSDFINLNIEGLSGKLKFVNCVPWPKKWYSPGIMGPFTFVPFMECYHGILSMDHTVEGSLTIKGVDVDFTGGRGYMEKDWGHSFPSAYIWMQSNHFSRPGISLKASVAKIPWLGSSFVGFIAGLYVDNELIQFTTYNGTKLKRSFADKEKVFLVMRNRKHTLEIEVNRGDETELASPIQGFMDGRISESMTSELHVKLIETKSKKVLFQDRGRHAGLEVAGKIEEIMI